MGEILFLSKYDIYKCAKNKTPKHCGISDKLLCGELTHYY